MRRLIDYFISFLEWGANNLWKMVLIFVGVWMVSGYFVNRTRCINSWSQAEYGPVTGCVVITANGKMPEKNVRVINWVYEE